MYYCLTARKRQNEISEEFTGKHFIYIEEGTEGNVWMSGTLLCLYFAHTDVYAHFCR